MHFVKKFKTDGFGLRPLIRKDTGRVGLNYFCNLVNKDLPYIYVMFNTKEGKEIIMDKSKGTLESEISKALTHWEKNYLGRGSVSVKSDILRDMVIVILTWHINSC